MKKKEERRRDKVRTIGGTLGGVLGGSKEFEDICQVLIFLIEPGI